MRFTASPQMNSLPSNNYLVQPTTVFKGFILYGSFHCSCLEPARLALSVLQRADTDYISSKLHSNCIGKRAESYCSPHSLCNGKDCFFRGVCTCMQVIKRSLKTPSILLSIRCKATSDRHYENIPQYYSFS